MSVGIILQNEEKQNADSRRLLEKKKMESMSQEISYSIILII